MFLKADVLWNHGDIIHKLICLKIEKVNLESLLKMEFWIRVTSDTGKETALDFGYSQTSFNKYTSVV